MNVLYDIAFKSNYAFDVLNYYEFMLFYSDMSFYEIYELWYMFY